MKPGKSFIIDFDSTFTRVEALDELAAIALKRDPERDRIVETIKNITKQGVEGKISFEESLRRRVALLRANRKHIEMLVKHLKKNVTPSFVRNKKFFKQYGDSIYIISGGFRDFIAPIVKSFGIPEDHVLANTFTFDRSGTISGYDTENPLAGKGGKTEAVKRLKLKGDIYVIGDGFTDYELKKSGVATKFFAFTENVTREPVVKVADQVIGSFDEFLYLHDLPRAVFYPKNRLKALLLENIHPDAASALKAEGYVVETLNKSLSEEELCERIKDVAILGIRSKTEVTKKVLAAGAERLLVVGAFCIGTNQIDLGECARHGVAVFNAPYSSTRSVVELVVGNSIMLARGVFDKSSNLHEGIWEKSAKGSFEIRGKKLGIIGYGNIGSQLSVVAEALGMEVYFYDIVEKLAMGNATRCDSMDELLKKSDIVTLHVDGSAENKNLISEKQFALMKQGVLFLNLSRGSVVDIKALAAAVKAGKVRGAAIDVYPHEPESNDEAFICELQHLPNVILTPHIGAATEEAQKNIGQFVSARIIDLINAGGTYLSVNLPNIQAPKLKNAHRFVHLHENVPGILAQVNGILAKHKINIVGQYLKTNETVGYVITDVSAKHGKEVIEELKNIPHTIRFRTLY